MARELFHNEARSVASCVVREKRRLTPPSGHTQQYHYIAQRYVTILIETWVMGRMYYLPTEQIDGLLMPHGGMFMAQCKESAESGGTSHLEIKFTPKVY